MIQTSVSGKNKLLSQLNTLIVRKIYPAQSYKDNYINVRMPILVCLFIFILSNRSIFARAAITNNVTIE